MLRHFDTSIEFSKTYINISFKKSLPLVPTIHLPGRLALLSSSDPHSWRPLSLTGRVLFKGWHKESPKSSVDWKAKLGPMMEGLWRLQVTPTGAPQPTAWQASSIFQHSKQMEGKLCPRPCHMPWIATIHFSETEPANKIASTDGPTLSTHMRRAAAHNHTVM